MTFAEFKRQLNEDTKEVLGIIEGEDYPDSLPSQPSLEDWYALFFTVWNDNISDVVFEER